VKCDCFIVMFPCCAVPWLALDAAGIGGRRVPPIPVSGMCCSQDLMVLGNLWTSIIVETTVNPP